MAVRKPHRRGLVVGKFCPLHRGHTLLIQAAIDACDEVIVISYTKPGFAGCGRAARESWIAMLFPRVRSLVVDDESLAALCIARGEPVRELPHNDAPDDVHREFTGWLCWALLQTTVDAVFTSEDYGDGFAHALSAYFAARSPGTPPVRHVCVDRNRVAVPISGSALRTDLDAHRRFLDPRVHASLVRRVCILGGESSGKTTLAQALAAHLETAWVPEFGRELWEQKGGALQFADMLHIAQVQAERELSMAQQARRWLVCDTNALVTAFYSLDLFGVVDPALDALAARSYAATFVCAPDFEFVQDGTRRDDLFRQRQHDWYVRELQRRGVAYTLLQGPLEGRVLQAESHLRHLAPGSADDPA